MNIRFEENDGVKRFFVNGTAYDRIEDVPEQYQKFFTDNNSNGIPDQFDDVFGALKGNASPKDLIGALRSKPAPKENSNRSNSSVQSPKKTESSTLLTLIKISLVIFIALIGYYGYLYFSSKNSGTVKNESNTPFEEPFAIDESTSTQPVEKSTNSAASEADANGMKVFFEDPNEPPYIAFGATYIKDKMAFKFDTPSGQLLDSPDNVLQIQMTPPEGTNLVSELFSVSTTTGDCQPEKMLAEKGEEVSSLITVDIGEKTFIKTESGESGAGQSYATHSYFYTHRGYCAAFSLVLQSSNVNASETPVQVFDEETELKNFENIIRSITIQE